MVNSLFIAATALIGFLSLILCFTEKRRYVLYFFALSVVLSPIIWGYMDNSGLLSLSGGRLWSVLDIQLLVLVLIAWPLARKNVIGRYSSFVDVAVLIMCLLTVLNFFVGYFRVGGFGGVLNIFRNFMSLPVYFVASVIMARPQNVKSFYKWVLWFCIVVFILHITIAMRIYEPALYSTTMEKTEAVSYRELFRSSIYLFEPYYIIAASVAISNMLFSPKGKILSLVVFLMAGFGTLYTQARGMYGGFFLIFVGVLLFTKLRAKSIIAALISGLLLLVIVLVVQARGFDVFFRFKQGRVESYFESVRGSEITNVTNSFLDTPQAIFTGQGFGIAVRGEVEATMRGFFHNDYIGTIFSLGLVGLACYCYVLWSSVFRGRRYCAQPELAELIMPVRLTFFAIAGYAIFNQTFWLFKGTGLLMVLLAISRNADFYAIQFYEQEQTEEGELYGEYLDEERLMYT